MNLQEILNYRNECIFCTRPLVMHISRYPKLLITQNDEGLLIKSKNKNGLFLDFKFDGKYERSKRDYEIHRRPIYIKKYCHFHPLYVGINVGTSINSIKDTTCHYAFTIFGDSQGNYDANMAYEGLAWHDEEEFWHVNTFHPQYKSHIYHGRYDRTIEDALHLKLPIINLSGAKNLEQYLSKLKLYALFS